MKEFPVMDPREGIPILYPHIPSNAVKYVEEVLSTRWIGQGSKVNQFEDEFSKKIVENGYSVAVNSGTVTPKSILNKEK